MTALLTAIVLKASLLMIAAAVLVALMYRASAATRHFVWTLVVAGLLLMPVLSATLPEWPLVVPIPTAQTSAAIVPVRTMSNPVSVETPERGADRLTPAPPQPTRGNGVPWPAWAAAIYMLGVVVLLGRLAVQRSSARRIVREAAAVSDAEWTSLLNDCAARIGVSRPVALRRSREQVMPMTTSTIAPSIVVPADADTWDNDRRRAVLLHELAHIARHDCLTQAFAAIASALYWCHPGVWYVARRLRIERELACDDRVLAAGAPPREYAGHLLDLAYAWSGRRAPALAVGMTSSHKLEGRMRAVLDPAPCDPNPSSLARGGRRRCRPSVAARRSDDDYGRRGCRQRTDGLVRRARDSPGPAADRAHAIAAKLHGLSGHSDRHVGGAALGSIRPRAADRHHRRAVDQRRHR
jgi:beta-lactamase regulating signal transducer with metallopeptidase domain